MTHSEIATLDLADLAARSLEQLGTQDAAGLEAIFGRLDAGLAAEVAALQAGATAEAVEALRVRWLGRKQGIVRGITDGWLKSAPGELKRIIGQRANALRQSAEQQIDAIPATASAPAEAASRNLQTTEVRPVAEALSLDITLPGTHRPIGVRHPLDRKSTRLNSSH